MNLTNTSVTLEDCLELTSLPGFEPGDTLERFGPKGLKGNAWVLRNKETGEAAMETSDPAKVRRLNVVKYEAVPVGRHLADLNDRSTAASQHARRGERPELKLVPTLAPGALDSVVSGIQSANDVLANALESSVQQTRRRART